MTIRGADRPGAPRYDHPARRYDAVLVVSFGGPEAPDQVMPFLENVTRGRNVPRERLLEVAEHYAHFAGVSPINAQNRALAAALEQALTTRGRPLPVYLGNRNWHPFLADTIRRMRDDGVMRAIACVTSAYSSYSGCRQYREDVLRACAAVGEGAPEFDKLRGFFNHPAFVETMADLLAATVRRAESDPATTAVIFTAHSIPLAMASACAYEAQLLEAGRLIASAAEVSRWSVAWQSRSGPPSVPWLGPDIGEEIRRLAGRGMRTIVAHPIGFLSDHMEVLYDLDVEARQVAERLEVALLRAPTAGTDPRFVGMLADLIEERTTERPVRPALGKMGPGPDICPAGCCLPQRSITPYHESG